MTKTTPIDFLKKESYHLFVYVFIISLVVVNIITITTTTRSNELPFEENTTSGIVTLSKGIKHLCLMSSKDDCQKSISLNPTVMSHFDSGGFVIGQDTKITTRGNTITFTYKKTTLLSIRDGVISIGTQPPPFNTNSPPGSIFLSGSPATGSIGHWQLQSTVIVIDPSDSSNKIYLSTVTDTVGKGVKCAMLRVTDNIDAIPYVFCPDGMTVGGNIDPHLINIQQGVKVWVDGSVIYNQRGSEVACNVVPLPPVSSIKTPVLYITVYSGNSTCGNFKTSQVQVYQNVPLMTALTWNNYETFISFFTQTESNAIYISKNGEDTVDVRLCSSNTECIIPILTRTYPTGECIEKNIMFAFMTNG